MDNTRNSFDDIIQEVQQIINSDRSSFGKAFAISELTRSDTINEMEISGFDLVPADINGVGVSG